MSWGKARRVDTPDGFMFLTPPRWFNALHLLGKKKQRGYAGLAYIAYWMQHEPSRLSFGKKPLTWLLVNYYPIYWLIVSLRTLGKRLLGVAILLAVLGVPFMLGYLVGAIHHISITIK